jgi:hypothetical protein
VPLTYGFCSPPPKAQVYKNPFTGAVIATPVLDIVTMPALPGVYIDRSGYGNNAGIVGTCPVRHGVFDTALTLAGRAADYLNCGSAASLDIGGNISAGTWLYSKGAALAAIMSKAGGALGWGLFLDAAGQIFVYFYSGGATWLQGVDTARNKWSHVFFTVQGTVGRAFLDGLQNVRGTVGMSDSPADVLILSNSGFPFTGSMELLQEWNGAISPEAVYRNYLEASKVPIYYDTFSGYPVSPAALGVGARCGPYRVLSNSLSVVADASDKHWVQGGGGGVTQWPENNAYGTVEFDFRKEQDASSEVYLLFGSMDGAWNAAAQNGYALRFTAVNHELQFWDILGGALTTLRTGTDVAFLALNTSYRFRVVRRPDNMWTFYVKGGTYTDWTLVTPVVPYVNPVLDSIFTTGPFHAMALDSPSKVSGITRLRTCVRPPSVPWEFSTGTYAGLVSGSTVWTRCVTAGVTYLPKDLDWTRCEIGVYKGADANVTDFCFVASEIGGTTFANQNGYCLRVSADERLQLIRMDAGAETLIAQTAAAYVANTTEYRVRINHDGIAHAYSFEILGGAYADWTAVSAISAVLGIHVTSNYMTWDLDAADRIAAPSFDLATA